MKSAFEINEVDREMRDRYLSELEGLQGELDIEDVSQITHYCEDTGRVMFLSNALTENAEVAFVVVKDKPPDLLTQR